MKTETIQVSLTDSLYELFKEHIGKENGIDQKDIMSHIYGKRMPYYQEMFIWYRKILPAMHYLRKNTKCFLISSWVKTEERTTINLTPDYERIFYVLKSKEELKHYKVRCKKQIKGLKEIIKRATLSVKEKWYNQL